MDKDMTRSEAKPKRRSQAARTIRVPVNLALQGGGAHGAFAWGVFEDTADEMRYVETFMVESWLEHLRQHERVTEADRTREETVRRFHRGGPLKITHAIQAEREG